MNNSDALSPCPNPWCCAGTPPLPARSGAPGFRWRIICACGVRTFGRCTEDEARALWNTRTQPATGDAARGILVSVREIETVPIDHPFSDEKTAPFWRIEIDGYCADFEFPGAAHNFRDAINARIETALRSPGREEWQPIETAPKDEWILVYMPDAHEGSGKIHAAKLSKIANGHSWYVGHHFGFDCEPRTHWQPLPAPPGLDPGKGEA